ncbi:polysaccharide pyruvyl transferase family protein [Roseobacter sp. GAI101]|uniref:polysaccharide pyruvyl transferase family protein n=1 Tax=Roseobacter sp. (strain GAI101) TaxID=391589 RepID=UPI00018715EB|nr:polysaccharide pyruvyl transferase family protein [Roseobacter sp. GAI101]EEB83226.1 ExoV domain protein [Roseobacter sp. GAI101]
MTVAADTTPLRLHWWKAVPNFGDAISPVVLAHVSGREVVHAGVNKADIWAVGSLLQVIKRAYSEEKDLMPTVWGTGLLHAVHGLRFKDHVRIALVRGPITAALLGLEVDRFGDPGLLISDVWPMDRTPNGKIGIVPHHSIMDDVMLKALLDSDPKYQLIDPRGDAREVCAAIAACDHVFASSLHGLIVADAYGVPNTWVAPVGQSRLKYLDYAAAVGRAMPAPVMIEDIPAAHLPEPDAPLPYQAGIDVCRNALYASFPKALRLGVAA